MPGMPGQPSLAAAQWAPPEVPIGWALRWRRGSRCAQCGELANLVHQRQRYLERQWEDEPGAVLCLTCFAHQYTRPSWWNDPADRSKDGDVPAQA